RSTWTSPLAQVDADVGGKARTQARNVGLVGVEPDAHRNALYDAGEVAGGGLEREQRELTAGAGGEAFNLARQRFAVQRIDGDVRVLADQHARGLGFLKVGDDVQGVHRHYSKELRTGLDVFSDLDLAVANDPVDRSADDGVGLILARKDERRVGAGECGEKLAAGLIDDRYLLIRGGVGGAHLVCVSGGAERGGAGRVTLTARDVSGRGELAEADVVCGGADALGVGRSDGGGSGSGIGGGEA